VESLTTKHHFLLLLLLCIVLLALLSARAPEQETGTLIVYKEAEKANETFTFNLNPAPGSFQITAAGGGGAQILDLPPGVTCTLTETPQSGWNLTDIFCEGSGNWTADVSRGTVTITLASPRDFVYCRFTNQRMHQPVDEADLLGAYFGVSIMALMVATSGRATAIPP